MDAIRENECLHCRFHRLVTYFFGTPEEKKAIQLKDLAYWKAQHERLAKEQEAEREEYRQHKLKEAAEAKKEREHERLQRILDKARAAKQRKNHLARVAAAKKFVKAKKLRKVRRDGSTVFVNQHNDIVNYAILAYLLSGSRSSDDSSYSYHSSSYDSSSSSSSSGSDFSSGGSDFGGSFGGGDSGGGGASGSW